MRQGKNFLPTLIIILFLWLCFAFLIFFVEPEMVKNIIIPRGYLPFFINFWLALFFTLAIILGNSPRGLLVSTFIIIFLILRLFKLGNWLNFLLLAAIAFAFDRYFKKTD